VPVKRTLLIYVGLARGCGESTLGERNATSRSRKDLKTTFCDLTVTQLRVALTPRRRYPQRPARRTGHLRGPPRIRALALVQVRAGIVAKLCVCGRTASGASPPSAAVRDFRPERSGGGPVPRTCPTDPACPTGHLSPRSHESPYSVAGFRGGCGLGGRSGGRECTGTAAEPGSTALGSLHATTVVPIAPRGPVVAPQSRLPGRIGAYGRFGGASGCPKASRKPKCSAIWALGKRSDRCQRHRGLNDQPAPWPLRPAGTVASTTSRHRGLNDQPAS
jgi:hypothetical protein